MDKDKVHESRHSAMKTYEDSRGKAPRILILRMRWITATGNLLYPLDKRYGGSRVCTSRRRGTGAASCFTDRHRHVQKEDPKTWAARNTTPHTYTHQSVI